MEGTDRADYLNLKLPCVFLEDKRCSVYEHRPVRCRAYFVFTDPKLCQPPSGQRVKFANYSEADEWISDWSHGIHKAMGLKETSMRVMFGSLPRVLLIVLKALDDDTDFKRWIRNQPWPSVNNLEEWVDGRPPEDKLVQIRTRPKEESDVIQK